MFFSIAIPVYNAENYLGECVQSVLNQTFKDFEVILVDDGSTDNSPAICDHFASQYPDLIKVHHKKNEGLLLTRRTGYKLACGEYVISLDADDMLRSDSLSILYERITEHNADIAMFNFANDRQFKISRQDIPFKENVIIEKKELYTILLTSYKLNNLANKCIKRSLININYDYSNFKFVSNGEDLLQLLPIIDKAKRVIYINQNLYYYRMNPNSITHVFPKKYLESIFCAGEELRKYDLKWFGDKKRAYRMNVFVCSVAVKRIIRTNLSIKQKYNKIKQIAKSDFFISAYKNCDLKQQSPKEKMITELLFILCKIK